MTNSRARGRLDLLDHHLATGTEATYTYTKTLDMKVTYREILIIITGKATAAFNLAIKLNAQTDYDYAQLMGDTTTASAALAAAQANVPLLTSAIIDGAVPFYQKLTIACNDADDTLMCLSHGSAPHEGQEVKAFQAMAGSTTTITSIEILTSTSTWIAGTEISIYGLKR